MTPEKELNTLFNKNKENVIFNEDYFMKKDSIVINSLQKKGKIENAFEQTEFVYNYTTENKFIKHKLCCITLNKRNKAIEVLHSCPVLLDENQINYRIDWFDLCINQPAFKEGVHKYESFNKLKIDLANGFFESVKNFGYEDTSNLETYIYMYDNISLINVKLIDGIKKILESGTMIYKL